MGKKLIILGLFMIVILTAGIFVAAADIEVGVKDYVEKFINKKGIEAEEITDINEVDFNDLPKEVNIESVGDTNLAIYQVDYNEGDEDKKVFVVTYSVEELKAQGDLIIAHDKRQFLNFGFAGEMSDSGFLKTATGVEGSLEKGYVMMREGSITGFSTNLEVVKGGEGQIEIIIYKNGKQVGFENVLDADLGMQKDYDVQSNDVVTFESGDVISVYVNAPEEIVWEDVISLIEITIIN